MRFAWMVLFLASCTEQEKGQLGFDSGIGMSASTSDPIAVGATYPFTFFDQCVPSRDGFCEYDSVASVGTAMVNGPFEVTLANSSGILVKAKGPGTGMMWARITQTDGEMKSFDRSFSAAVADRASMYCFGFMDATEPQIVMAGSTLEGVLFHSLYAGATLLYSADYFPYEATGLEISGKTVKAPATPGPITLTAPFDAQFSFPLDVVTLSQIDNLELVKVPQMSNIYVGFQIKPTVGGKEMCRPPWEAMTMTAGPAGICSLTQTLKLPATLPQVQLHAQGNCHVEARITGTTLVASADFSL